MPLFVELANRGSAVPFGTEVILFEVEHIHRRFETVDLATGVMNHRQELGEW